MCGKVGVTRELAGALQRNTFAADLGDANNVDVQWCEMRSVGDEIGGALYSSRVGWARPVTAAAACGPVPLASSRAEASTAGLVRSRLLLASWVTSAWTSASPGAAASAAVTAAAP
jgi:hypothetical protein